MGRSLEWSPWTIPGKLCRTSHLKKMHKNTFINSPLSLTCNRIQSSKSPDMYLSTISDPLKLLNTVQKKIVDNENVQLTVMENRVWREARTDLNTKASFRTNVLLSTIIHLQQFQWLHVSRVCSEDRFHLPLLFLCWLSSASPSLPWRELAP